MSNKTTEALKLAEEALESCVAGDYSTGHVIHQSFNNKAVDEALASIREALAEPVQEHESREDIAAKEMFEGFSKAWAAPVKQEVTDVLNVALEALIYHTEQTRPIHKTDDAISQIQSFLDKGATKMKHINPIKHTTADNYEHFLSYMYGAGARHNALLCKAYFDGSDAPHEEYEAYMAAHPEPVKQEPFGYFSVNDYGNWEQNESDYGTPLYAAPVELQWVDLTDDEVFSLGKEKKFPDTDPVYFARAVIAAFKGKNK